MVGGGIFVDQSILCLTREKLINTRWVFGQIGAAPLSDRFCFDEAGKIFGYDHPNEQSWALNDGVLEIYNSAGDLFWRSEQLYSYLGLCCTLRHKSQPAAHFVLREYRGGSQQSAALPSLLDDASFLFPKDLEVSETKLKRILMIGSCLSQFYFLEFKIIAPETEIDYIPFNFAAILPSQPPAPVSDYEFQYIQIPLRSVLGDRVIWGNQFTSTSFAEEILQEAYGVIDVMLQAALAYNTAHGLLSFVTNFFVPQMNVAPSLSLQGSAQDLAYIVEKLNQHLASAVRRYANTYLLDVNALGNSIGKRYFRDDTTAFFAHGGILEVLDADFVPNARIEPLPSLWDVYENRKRPFAQAAFAQMVAAYRTVRQIDQVKAVIFDLDNTLWRGQIAEDYRPGKDWPAYGGFSFGIWEAIHYLRARGILVAICSKNDHAVVEELWQNAVQPNWIGLQDFASVKINWQPKSENIKEICAEFNIKPKSVVFVDDNPVERAEVKAALPEIRVIGANPYLVRRILLWAPETQTAQLTTESIRREEMIRSQIKRDEVRSSSSREAFLGSLASQIAFVEILDTKDSEFSRALELINKTNQFNTTGRRWSFQEAQAFLDSGGMIQAFRVRDRFANYGLVGVLLTAQRVIVQFVMSCRVLGMEIEQAALAHVCALIRKRRGEGAIFAELIETPDNFPCRMVYREAGFEGDGRSVLAADQSVVWPGHITIVDSGDWL